MQQSLDEMNDAESTDWRAGRGPGGGLGRRNWASCTATWELAWRPASGEGVVQCFDGHGRLRGHGTARQAAPQAG